VLLLYCLKIANTFWVSFFFLKFGKFSISVLTLGDQLLTYKGKPMRLSWGSRQLSVEKRKANQKHFKAPISVAI